MASDAIAALLFDLDGTLIDSMPHHGAAWVEWHRRRALPFDAATFFERTAGRANEEILSEMMPTTGPREIAAAAEEKEQLYRAIAARELTAIAGFDAVHRRARERGLRLAICTAAPPANMAIAFQRFGLARLVDTVVSPADGLRGKPHPDLFLEAASRLGVAPAACVVFEDAPLGIEAARRAGMRAVALTTSLPPSAFAEYPNVLACVRDFAAFDLDTLFDPTARVAHS